MRTKTIAFGAALLALMFVTVGVTASSQATVNQTTPLRGAYFYVWYGYNETSQQWQGGNLTSHWNDQPERSFLDRPLSWYSSMNDTVIAWQISEMHKAKLNFVAISWWGPNDYTDESMRHFVQYLDATNDTLQFAIMIEPYSELNLTDAQDYIWSIYQMYGEHVFQWEGKPLVTFFTNQGFKGDSRFTARAVTNHGTIGLVEAFGFSNDWNYVQGMSQYMDGTNKPSWEEKAYGAMQISIDKVVSISPRFDNYYEYSIGGRSDYIRFNVNGEGNMLQQELAWANRNGAKLIIYTSFNEYTEGSMIEPHYDANGNLVEYF